jgi:lipoprotein-anchoring transpeptidase ErfK/SrfK
MEGTTAKAGKASKIVATLVLLLSAPLLAQDAFAQASATQSQELPSDHSQRVALVSIPDRKLAVLDGDQIIATFPVAVGAAVSPSPTGEFQITSRVANPTYYHSGKVIPHGKDNPLGTRWLGLSQKGYGIHGTNAPSSVGHAASHGCIRLRNRDMERLYSMLRLGDSVVIRGERDQQTAEVFGRGNDTKDDTRIAEALVNSASGGQ